jgi:hypothetical protein
MRVSGFKAITNFSGQPTVREQKIKRKRKVRAHTQHLVFARLAFTSPSKKHDKQLTFIVRVSSRSLCSINEYFLAYFTMRIVPFERIFD